MPIVVVGHVDHGKSTVALDAPGHAEFLRTMVTGAARAGVAVPEVRGVLSPS